MNQPFNFDPKQMSEAMEQWQKLWLNAWQPGANATKQTQAPESNNVWQQMLTQQTEMWQKNLASVFSLPNNHVPSVTEQWQTCQFTSLQVWICPPNIIRFNHLLTRQRGVFICSILLR